MICNFNELMAKALELGKTTICVAGANDKDVLETVKSAIEIGLADAILVGDATDIKRLLLEVGLSNNISIIDEPDLEKAAKIAVSLVRKEEAQVLVKGMINSSDYLKAVLKEEEGLRTGRLLSHFVALEIQGHPRLLFVSDGGMNPAPGLAEKKDILTNALLALDSLGLSNPNVAILTANEKVSKSMPATVDAKALVDMSLAGELPPAIIEGPMAMDVVMNPEAAKHKGINSKVSGNVDFILVPTIETGNAVCKTLVYFMKAKIAGVILGATHPIIMTSRAETAEDRLNSIAIGCLVAHGMKKRIKV